MIHGALQAVARQLTRHLESQGAADADAVRIGPLVDGDGTPSPDIEGRLVLSVVNVARDAAYRPGPRREPTPPHEALHALTVHVVLAAGYGPTTYGHALELVDRAVRFVVTHPVLDRSTTPDLDPALDRLLLDLEPMAWSDTARLWRVLGGRYLPSVVCQLRLFAHRP